MKNHEILFCKIGDLLKKHFPVELVEYDDGDHLVVGKTGIWIECDDSELTIGYGFAHTHHNPDYDNFNVAIENFFKLITIGKRITIYYKGNFQYKNKTENILSNGALEHQGTSMTWLYPFWKKTSTEIKIVEPLILESVILEEMEDIRNYVKRNFRQ